MSDQPNGLQDFQALLVLQGTDIQIDQLTHKRSHLPVLTQIQNVNKAASALRDRLGAANAAVDQLAESQASFEAEIDTIARRVAQIDERLYGTNTVSPKDAQAMSEEVVHLRERKNGIEDEELEVMESLEPAQAAAADLEEQARNLGEQMQQLQSTLASEQGEIDDQLGVVRQKRAEEAAPIPATLIAEYERLRVSLGGVAAAALTGTSCDGCHLTMAGGELDRLRKAPPEAVLHCEECGRILVRR